MDAHPAEREKPRAFSEKEKAALVCLLKDEDPKVFSMIRDTLAERSTDGMDWLQSLRLHDDLLVRKRARLICRQIHLREADHRFLKFCLLGGDHLDLERACLLLSQTEDPGISVDGYRALLDDYARDLLPVLDYGSEPEALLGQFHEHLFGKLGFQGDHEDYYSADNSLLSKVMDRRKGNPITLSVVYMAVARRLRLPVAGIGLPGHFLCRFQTPKRELYVDPFNGGKMLTRKNCLDFLQKTGHPFHVNFLSPVSPRRMLLRICSNLHRIHSKNGDTARIERFHGYLAALTRRH